MSSLPGEMHDLEEERDLLERSMEAMGSATVPAERADLARAIAILGARYESVTEDSLYYVLRETRESEALGEGEQRLSAARTALKDVRDKMRHVKAINAHADDPDGFEQSIQGMVNALRALLDYEDEVLFPLVGQLDSSGRELLVERMKIGLSRETSLPDPPNSPILRKLATLKENVELALNDESTPWHPGLERVGSPVDGDRRETGQ
jgi:hypothetical protein